MATPTRKDIKKAEELRISQIGDFKKRLGGTIELPSGFVVKVRNPGGLQAFMMNGTIPNSLMPIIKNALDAGKAPDPKDLMLKNGELDPSLFKAMGEMLDAVALQCIVNPTIHPVPASEDERSDEQLYVDELPFDDKQFLMQWMSGGTKDLETFRQQQQQGVDAVAASQNAVRAAQRNLGTDEG